MISPWIGRFSTEGRGVPRRLRAVEAGGGRSRAELQRHRPVLAAVPPAPRHRHPTYLHADRCCLTRVAFRGKGGRAEGVPRHTWRPPGLPFRGRRRCRGRLRAAGEWWGRGETRERGWEVPGAGSALRVGIGKGEKKERKKKGKNGGKGSKREVEKERKEKKEGREEK